MGAKQIEGMMLASRVPYALVSKDSPPPLSNWDRQFADMVEPLTLGGRVATTVDDAYMAVADILRRGGVEKVRGKLPGQSGEDRHRLVRNEEDLLRMLDEVLPDDLASQGVIFEPNLSHPSAMQVGRVRLPDGLEVAYVGTRSGRVGQVGRDSSSYQVVRGGFSSLSDHASPHIRRAVELGMKFDAARAERLGSPPTYSNYDTVSTGPDFDSPSGVLGRGPRDGVHAAKLAIDIFRGSPEITLVTARSSRGISRTREELSYPIAGGFMNTQVTGRY